MIRNTKNPPIIPLDDGDTDESREPTGEDLKFNENENSFELDVETEDDEYQHPDPYDTAAPNGEDDNSTYDEENPYTPNEYRDKESELKGELEELDGTVENDNLILNERDERLAETPEDERGDLDEEGYPRRGDAGGDDNPILVGPDEDDEPIEDDPSEVEVPPYEDPRRADDEPVGDDPDRPILPEEVPPVDERDPLGDKQIQSDDPTETTG